jgi:hypothetical protein
MWRCCFGKGQGFLVEVYFEEIIGILGIFGFLKIMTVTKIGRKTVIIFENFNFETAIISSTLENNLLLEFWESSRKPVDPEVPVNSRTTRN